MRRGKEEQENLGDGNPTNPPGGVPYKRKWEGSRSLGDGGGDGGKTSLSFFSASSWSSSILQTLKISTTTIIITILQASHGKDLAPGALDTTGNALSAVPLMPLSASSLTPSSMSPHPSVGGYPSPHYIGPGPLASPRNR